MVPFKFMELPGELRNWIYEFHGASEPETKFLHRPNAAQLYINAEPPPNRFALAQTCRQLRSEYLSPCWQGARLKIRWEDAPAFFNQFLSYNNDIDNNDMDNNNLVINRYRAPSKLTILVGAEHLESGPSLEVLPFIQLRVAGTKCSFDIDEDRVRSVRESDNAEIDCNTMHAFLSGSLLSRYWCDVALNKFSSILWSRVHKPNTVGSDRWQQRVQLTFKASCAPGDWAVVEGQDCPKYLADTVFVGMEEEDRDDLEGTLNCTFIIRIV